MPSERLEWNEENFKAVLADLYREIETDESLRQRMLADPFAVLSERLLVPETYRGGIFAREKGLQTLMLYLPAPGTTRRANPEGTTEIEPQEDYDPLCTAWPIW